ncbi:beta-mannosidase [Deinococcus cellulosilyticus]|uniref:Beta-mannosidase B n=1 Tax=Deinococcus cellulosilyticus (strain DSM 18568 / NBRC 106333 / KACC 11606 / 5516J-15) TaxID=1223518 RepID=A0A511MV36_DEIC1|nr:sugar-binding domain-containing protein [Deinococcus cellulosilyticus]GEM44442.1 beta-mannosidase [Deinococcus cellulosilyticus NBRC 106333 = KACC 11606]
MTTLTLHTRWEFKQRDPASDLQQDFGRSEGWQSATVPGTVQQDLLHHGQIEDPYYGLNERDVQWIGEKDWLYRSTFDINQSTLQAKHLHLTFEGLDTISTVFLNGQQVLQSDNMFTEHTLDIRDLLQEGENTLWVLFESPLKVGHAREAAGGVRAAWNGDTSRVYLRKAQYHYGWDWGPVILTAGIWKDVKLQAFEVVLKDVYVPAEVTPDLLQAFIPVHVTLGGDVQDVQVQVRLKDPEGREIQQVTLEGAPVASALFEVATPELWYPSGRGAQPLYTVQVELHQAGTLLEQKSVRIGLRRIRVVQERVRGEQGSSFTFEVNNEPFFVGGANWIPEHLLLNTVTEQQYRERLTQARDANMTMVRVWGGGIYEADVFYDLCDELGLLVWQDFMFACGMYPGDEAFRNSVRLEAEQQVTRLRNHACLALWCGNNEDYQIAQAVGAYGPGGDESKFHAQHIYEVLLREVCERLDPNTLYWPGSPYGGADVFDKTIGDRHTWEIWHGPMAPYQEYKNYEGRFVSEFGLMSAPSLQVIQQAMPEHEQFPESETFVHHTRALGPNFKPDGARRLAVYQAENLRGHKNLEEYIYNTQLVQAEAMRYAYRDFRKRFDGPGKYAVSGALVWQLNDCWPVSSWAIIDSAGIPKPAYYTIKRELAPITVGIHLEAGKLETWVCSSGRESRTLQLKRYAYTLQGEKVAEDTCTVTVLPARRTDVPSWQVDRQPLVYFAELQDGTEVVARASHFPEPFKSFDFSQVKLNIEVQEDGKIHVSADRPAKGVWLSAGPGVCWSDNFLDVHPGEVRVVQASGLRDTVIQVSALGLPEALECRALVVG